MWVSSSWFHGNVDDPTLRLDDNNTQPQILLAYLLLHAPDRSWVKQGWYVTTRLGELSLIEPSYLHLDTVNHITQHRA